MLQNAYLLAKIGADTAENEQHFAEILPKISNYPTGRRSQQGISKASARTAAEPTATGSSPVAALRTDPWLGSLSEIHTL